MKDLKLGLGGYHEVTVGLQCLRSPSNIRGSSSVLICDWLHHQHRHHNHVDLRAASVTAICMHISLQPRPLELLFNSIRAAGGWNNNPSPVLFQSIFCRLMVRCGVSPGSTGNVTAQDGTVSLPVVDMSSVVTADDADTASSNHHYSIMSLVVSYFHKLRQHHIAKLHTLQLQSGSL